MANLLAETLEIMKIHNKSPIDVRWVGVLDPAYLRVIRIGEEFVGSWDDFQKWADFEYNDGYGGAEVNAHLHIVGDNWWLERGEYDGSEWWEFKTLPLKPNEGSPLHKKDLLERP